MNRDNCENNQEKRAKKSHIGLWLSKSEKILLKNLAQRENFSSISQFIRSRCLSDQITNSELADRLMTNIGRKFSEEYKKHCPNHKEKCYTIEMLKKPHLFSNVIDNNAKKEKEDQKKTARIKRILYVGFVLTEQEKLQLKLNAKKYEFSTVSKYIRNRCLKEQINKMDLITILIAFITNKLTEWLISPDKNLQWKKENIKKKYSFSPITAGFSPEKREQFEKALKDLTDTYSNEIQEELTSILLMQKQKLEKALVC